MDFDVTFVVPVRAENPRKAVRIARRMVVEQAKDVPALVVTDDGSRILIEEEDEGNWKRFSTT